MSEIDTKSVGNTPKWDGQAELLGRYLGQVKAITEVYDCGDALDKTAMGTCPTKTEYEELDTTKPVDVQKALLYRQLHVHTSLVLVSELGFYSRLVLSGCHVINIHGFLTGISQKN